MCRLSDHNKIKLEINNRKTKIFQIFVNLKHATNLSRLDITWNEQ